MTMTDDQIDALILKTLGSGTRANLRVMIRTAVAAERERCASVCDALAMTGPMDEERALRNAASRIRGS